MDTGIKLLRMNRNTIVYPDDTQTFWVFDVSNLSAAMDYLMSEGVESLPDMPQQAAPGMYMAFKDPFGPVHE